jgi:transcriptional regulator GlxA family with amidase domain
MRRTAVLVAFEGVQLLDVAGPADVLDAATKVLALAPGELDRRVNGTILDLTDVEPGDDGYTCIVATPTGRPVSTSAGLRIAADARLSEVDGRDVDTLIVAGALSMLAPLQDRRLVGELPRIAAGVRRICSVCGGAFLLAEAGLLVGRKATTHWAGCPQLAQAYPSVQVEPDRIFVRDGNVMTSAGVTAGIDLALALVEQDFGPAVARTVARWLVVFLRRGGGQSQFSERLALPVLSESPIRVIVDEIVATPGSDHRLPRLADRAALSERQLSRVFLRETHTTPGRFVERVRVEAARELLENSVTSMDAIAVRCGFGSTETMRRAFKRVISIGPGEYRDRFRCAELAMP